MAITFTSLATGSANTTNNAASHTGTAGTPVSGDLLICIVLVSDNTVTGSMSGTFTWIFLDTIIHQTDTIYIFYANATSATSVTPVYTISGTSTGSAMYCVRIAGAEGQAQPYIRQSAGSSGSVANPNVVMSKAILTGNGCLGIAKINSSTANQWTAPTGWTEMTELAYATPAMSLEVATRASGETGTTITWTNANAVAGRVTVYEFYVAGTGPVTADPSCGILTT